MLMKTPEKKSSTYRVDLVAIDGDGSFQCPKCGLTISPEDETEENYKVIDTKIIKDELVELVIACNKCRTTIEITGFQQE